MLKVTICDDNPTENSYLSGLVQKWAAERGHHIRMSNFGCAESFLFAYEDDKSVDILLLDIQMKEMDGMELAREIRRENSTVQIAFITGFPDYMAQGYDVSAVHYLMKPVKEDKLLSALDKAVENLGQKSDTVLLDIGGESVLLPVDTIIYAEALDHFLDIHTTGEKLTIKMPMYKLAEKLDFISCHRSYLVNPLFIQKITRTEVILDTGQTLPLSRRLYGDVNKAMLQYIAKGRVKK